jgi:nucleoid-associated protein YgaU
MKDKILVCFLFLICLGISACGSTGNDADSEEEEAIRIGETLTDDLDESLSDGEEEEAEELAENEEEQPADLETPGIESASNSPSDSSSEDFFSDAADESSEGSSGSSDSGYATNDYGSSDDGAAETMGSSGTTYGGSADSSSSYADSSDSSDFRGSGEWGEHNVQKGETLMKIAFNIYGDIDMWRYVYNENRDKFRNGRPLMVGMRLKYEKPTSPFVRDTSGEGYLIKEGDSLGGIALDLYGKVSKWRKIFNRNRDLIKDPNKIYAGFWLYYDRSAEEISDAQRYRENISSNSAPAPAPVQNEPPKVAEPEPVQEPAPVEPEPAPVEQVAGPTQPEPVEQSDLEEQAMAEEEQGILLPPEQENEVEQGADEGSESAGNEDFEDYRFPSGSF